MGRPRSRAACGSYIATSITITDTAMWKVEHQVEHEGRQRQHHHRQDEDDEGGPAKLADVARGEEGAQVETPFMPADGRASGAEERAGRGKRGPCGAGSSPAAPDLDTVTWPSGRHLAADVGVAAWPRGKAHYGHGRPMR